MATVNKTVRFSKEDLIGLKDIMARDPKCDNYSKAMYFGFKNAREKGFNIKIAANFIVKSDKDTEIDESEYASPKSFTAEEIDWDYALNEYRTQLNVERVHITSLARLIIKNYRMRLNEETIKPEVKIKTKSIDGVELLQKVTNIAAELIKTGNVDRLISFIEEEEK